MTYVICDYLTCGRATHASYFASHLQLLKSPVVLSPAWPAQSIAAAASSVSGGASRRPHNLSL